MVDDRFKKIVENLPEVVWLLDDEFQEVLYVNSVYEKFIKRIESEGDWSLSRENLIDPINEQAAREWLTQIEQDIADGTWSEEYEYEVNITAQDGTEYWVETIGIPMVQDEAVVGFVGLSSDITEQVARQKELEDEVNRLDQFVSMISHDLRTPLTVARANYDLYKETQDPEALEKIGEAISRTEEITSDLLELSGHKNMSSESTVVSLETTAREAWQRIDAPEATLETQQGEIIMDRSKLQTLFENLFRNAVEHGGSNVTVRVGLLDNGFYVEDTGSGMADNLGKEVLEHGFTTGDTGSGIGLTIITRIAELHNWTIEMGESQEGGARFEFHQTNKEPDPINSDIKWA